MSETRAPRGPYRTGRERIEKIIDAAHELFITRGYRATSLRDIAKGAGISHPSLLRYFATREEILAALISRMDQRSADYWALLEGGPERPTPAEIARVNQDVPGWVELFTALLGEATSASHPGHAQMLARRREGVRMGVHAFGELGIPVPRARNIMRQLIAGWEGLQILSLYFSDTVRIAEMLERYASVVPQNLSPVTIGSPSRSAAQPVSIDPIVAAATRLYAQRGYFETTMQAVADETGISRATLIHFAPTKRALLERVLERIIDADGRSSAAMPLGVHPRWNTAAEIVLVCEATVVSHPAHERIAQRLQDARTSVAVELAGAGAGDASQYDADWLLAVALGSLIAALYEPGEVDPVTVMGEARAGLLVHSPGNAEAVD